ncbi:tail completion and sheath stabilizer protein [Morganella phage vB_Mm5]
MFNVKNTNSDSKMNPPEKRTILNLSSKTNFKLEIPDNDITKGLQLVVQGVTIPSVTMMASDVPLNPTLRSKIPGSAVEFEPLIVKFIVDEEFDSVCGIYNWMLNIIDYVDSDSKAWLESRQNIALHIMDNSQNKTILTYRFYGAWPQFMGDLDVEYTSDVEESIVGIVTFNYYYYEIEKDGVVIRPKFKKPR